MGSLPETLLSSPYYGDGKTIGVLDLTRTSHSPMQRASIDAHLITVFLNDPGHLATRNLSMTSTPQQLTILLVSEQDRESEVEIPLLPDR